MYTLTHKEGSMAFGQQTAIGMDFLILSAKEKKIDKHDDSAS